MSNFKILLKKDILEIFRTKKWLIYLLVFAFVAILSVVTARVLPEILNAALGESGLDGLVFQYEISLADSYAQLIANFGEIVWVLIAVMFSYTLCKEKKLSSYNLLKCEKVKERDIVLAHFVSKLLLITISYLVSVGLFAVLNLIFFKEYAGLRGVVSLSFLYLSLVFALTVSLFVSSFVNKRFKGILFTMIIYFVLTFASIFRKIIVNPMLGLTLANEIISKVEYKTSEYVINFVFTLALIIGMLIASVYLMKNKIDNRKKD